MKTLKIAALKANLSRVLREVQAGSGVTVLDRERAVAQITPIEAAARSDPWQRLAREGRCRLGTQDFKRLKFSRLSRPVDLGAIVAWTRGDRET